jgi:CheY-like chemotaxis protein
MVEAGKNGHRDGQVGTAENLELSPDLLRTWVHELRNPLAPIRNATELLRTLCTGARQLQSVDIIARQVSALTRALDDLTSALDATQSPLLLSKQAVDVAAIVEPALQAVRPAADAQRQSVLVSLPNEPVQMHCDAPRLTQVVQTLLENAVRQTPAGGSIALQVSRQADRLLIEVLDDGAGIQPERRRSLFNVFARRSPAVKAGASGAELSLVISRNIVEMHGGSIQAFSDGAGRGSRFVICLPLSGEVSGPQARESSGPPVDARKILIIDDHEDTVSSLRDVLAENGHAVVAASTGEQGLVLAEAFEPDAVIVDIGLPGMDGFEVARRLREASATADTLLIAVSGFSLKRFRELAAYSMFRHYLLKPTHPETILAIIEGTPGRSRRAPGRSG